MTQLGFYYDAENCIGCRTCQVACKDTNRLKVGENYRSVSSYATGDGFKPHLYHLSIACNHCDAPACVAACSQVAIAKSTDGLVLIDNALCNGCRDCIDACPYHAITFIESENMAAKCDGCIALRGLGEQPACVAACPQRVLEFGEINELRSTHTGEGLVVEVAALPRASQTSPNLVMRIKPCMLDPDYDNFII